MRKNKNKSLSIVLPILNEEKNLKKLIYLIHKNLKFKNKEILCIDDNSIDNSVKEVNKLKKKYKFIKLFIRKNKIRDLSKSCELGFLKSKFEHILVMDSDMQHHPRYIDKMLNKFFTDEIDIVIAARKFHLNSSVLELSYIRYLSSIFLIKIFNFFSPQKSLDPMSGFFIFKKKLYSKYKKKMYLKGYKILADILLNTKKLKIDHILIDFYKRQHGKSKMNLKVVFNLINLYLRMIKNFFFNYKT